MERKHDEDTHMKKMGNMAHTEPMREMRIEIHRGPKNKLTGFTVHHHMMPKATKSAAFSENTTHSHPFSADEHEQMMDHVSEHLGAQAGAATPKEAPGGANEMEEEPGGKRRGASPRGHLSRERKISFDAASLPESFMPVPPTNARRSTTS